MTLLSSLHLVNCSQKETSLNPLQKEKGKNSEETSPNETEWVGDLPQDRILQTLKKGKIADCYGNLNSSEKLKDAPLYKFQKELLDSDFYFPLADFCSDYTISLTYEKLLKLFVQIANRKDILTSIQLVHGKSLFLNKTTCLEIVSEQLPEIKQELQKIPFEDSKVINTKIYCRKHIFKDILVDYLICEHGRQLKFEVKKQDGHIEKISDYMDLVEFIKKNGFIVQIKVVSHNPFFRVDELSEESLNQFIHQVLKKNLKNIEEPHLQEMETFSLICEAFLKIKVEVLKKRILSYLFFPDDSQITLLDQSGRTHHFQIMTELPPKETSSLELLPTIKNRTTLAIHTTLQEIFDYCFKIIRHPKNWMEFCQLTVKGHTSFDPKIERDAFNNALQLCGAAHIPNIILFSVESNPSKNSNWMFATVFAACQSLPKNFRKDVMQDIWKRLQDSASFNINDLFEPLKSLALKLFNQEIEFENSFLFLDFIFLRMLVYKNGPTWLTKHNGTPAIQVSIYGNYFLHPFNPSQTISEFGKIANLPSIKNLCALFPIPFNPSFDESSKLIRYFKIEENSDLLFEGIQKCLFTEEKLIVQGGYEFLIAYYYSKPCLNRFLNVVKLISHLKKLKEFSLDSLKEILADLDQYFPNSSKENLLKAFDSSIQDWNLSLMNQSSDQLCAIGFEGWKKEANLPEDGKLAFKSLSQMKSCLKLLRYLKEKDFGSTEDWQFILKTVSKKCSQIVDDPLQTQMIFEISQFLGWAAKKFPDNKDNFEQISAECFCEIQEQSKAFLFFQACFKENLHTTEAAKGAHILIEQLSAQKLNTETCVASLAKLYKENGAPHRKNLNLKLYNLLKEKLGQNDQEFNLAINAFQTNADRQINQETNFTKALAEKRSDIAAKAVIAGLKKDRNRSISEGEHAKIHRILDNLLETKEIALALDLLALIGCSHDSHWIKAITLVNESNDLDLKKIGYQKMKEHPPHQKEALQENLNRYNEWLQFESETIFLTITLLCLTNENQYLKAFEQTIDDLLNEKAVLNNIFKERDTQQKRILNFLLHTIRIFSGKESFKMPEKHIEPNIQRMWKGMKMVHTLLEKKSYQKDRMTLDIGIPQLLINTSSSKTFSEICDYVKSHFSKTDNDEAFLKEITHNLFCLAYSSCKHFEKDRKITKKIDGMVCYYRTHLFHLLDPFPLIFVLIEHPDSSLFRHAVELTKERTHQRGGYKVNDLVKLHFSKAFTEMVERVCLNVEFFDLLLTTKEILESSTAKILIDPDHYRELGNKIGRSILYSYFLTDKSLEPFAKKIWDFLNHIRKIFLPNGSEKFNLEQLLDHPLWSFFETRINAWHPYVLLKTLPAEESIKIEMIDKKPGKTEMTSSIYVLNNFLDTFLEFFIRRCQMPKEIPTEALKQFDKLSKEIIESKKDSEIFCYKLKDPAKEYLEMVSRLLEFKIEKIEIKIMLLCYVWRQIDSLMVTATSQVSEVIAELIQKFSYNPLAYTHEFAEIHKYFVSMLCLKAEKFQLFKTQRDRLSVLLFTRSITSWECANVEKKEELLLKPLKELLSYHNLEAHLRAVIIFTLNFELIASDSVLNEFAHDVFLQFAINHYNKIEEINLLFKYIQFSSVFLKKVTHRIPKTCKKICEHAFKLLFKLDGKELDPAKLSEGFFNTLQSMIFMIQNFSEDSDLVKTLLDRSFHLISKQDVNLVLNVKRLLILAKGSKEHIQNLKKYVILCFRERAQEATKELLPDVMKYLYSLPQNNEIISEWLSDIVLESKDPSTKMAINVHPISVKMN